MLAMSALVILVVASMSFTPAPPDQAFAKMVGRFNMVFPEKGRSRVMMGSGGLGFGASDVQPTGDGYRLRLSVTANAHVTVNGKPDLSQGDAFRQTVLSWAKPAGKAQEVQVQGKKVEV